MLVSKVGLFYKLNPDKIDGWFKKLIFLKIFRKKCLTAGSVLGITNNALRYGGSEKARWAGTSRVLKRLSEKTLKKVVDRKKQMMHKASSPLMSGGGSLTSE